MSRQLTHLDQLYYLKIDFFNFHNVFHSYSKWSIFIVSRFWDKRLEFRTFNRLILSKIWKELLVPENVKMYQFYGSVFTIYHRKRTALPLLDNHWMVVSYSFQFQLDLWENLKVVVIFFYHRNSFFLSQIES